MKKGFLSLIIACLMLAVLSACGGEKAEMPTPEVLRENLNACFSDELTLVESKLGRTLYGLDEAKSRNAWFWMASGGTTEELMLIHCADEAAAEEVLQAAQRRIETQTETYKSYAPKEVTKLENSLVRRNGAWVVLCVSDQAEEAARILTEYFPQ